MALGLSHWSRKGQFRTDPDGVLEVQGSGGPTRNPRSGPSPSGEGGTLKMNQSGQRVPDDKEILLCIYFICEQMKTT